VIYTDQIAQGPQFDETAGPAWDGAVLDRRGRLALSDPAAVSQRTLSVISRGRTIFATSAWEYVLTSGTSSGTTHTLTCICLFE
jgi:hypothetical protein